MTANLPPALARALLPMAPPSSVVHKIVGEEADLHYLQLRNSGELERRRFAEAERIQQKFQDATGVTL